jgi:hypothetical protein
MLLLLLLQLLLPLMPHLLLVVQQQRQALSQGPQLPLCCKPPSCCIQLPPPADAQQAGSLNALLSAIAVAATNSTSDICNWICTAAQQPPQTPLRQSSLAFLLLCC